MKRSKRHFFFLLFPIFIVLAGLAVMLLWNWIIPDLMGWAKLTFWKALGLLVLSKLLFGGLGGRRNKHWKKIKKKQSLHSKWSQMSPEDKELFFFQDFKDRVSKE